MTMTSSIFGCFSVANWSTSIIRYRSISTLLQNLDRLKAETVRHCVQHSVRQAKRERLKYSSANLLDDELPEIPGELERHQALINELAMPRFAAEVTYSSVEGRYLPEEFRNIKFSRVGS